MTPPRRSQPEALISLLFLTIPLMLAGVLPAPAEESSQVNPGLGPGDDAFISRQTAAFLEEADSVINENPPTWPEPTVRRLALYLVDAALHDTHAPNQPAVQEFYHERMERAIADIEVTHPVAGLRIWKLYNHGFVVRTPSISVAFDAHRGPSAFRWDGPDGRKRVPSPGFPLPDALADRLVAQCDVLFVSHMHGDHVDEHIIGAFLDQGKPVVAPETALAASPLHDRITHLKRKAHTVQTLPIQQGARELQVVIYPGQQYQGSGTPNNVALVISPEGLAFLHNGDQINDPYPEYQEDFKWNDAVHEHHAVDVLLTNNWSNDIFRMVRGIEPKAVVLGHQNELGHQMNDRVPYWGDAAYLSLNIESVAEAGYPVINMAWGEHWDYLPGPPVTDKKSE